MDRKTAEEFWTTYFGLIMHEGADTCMGNPFKEFIKEARIGTYDALTDDEYHVKYQQAEEISAFWNGRSKRSAGQVFAEALSRHRYLIMNRKRFFQPLWTLLSV